MGRTCGTELVATESCAARSHGEPGKSASDSQTHGQMIDKLIEKLEHTNNENTKLTRADAVNKTMYIHRSDCF